MAWYWDFLLFLICLKGVLFEYQHKRSNRVFLFSLLSFFFLTETINKLIVILASPTFWDLLLIGSFLFPFIILGAAIIIALIDEKNCNNLAQ